MRKGDRLRLRVSALDDEAAGVAQLEGTRVHVQGALPDEEIDAVVAHVSPHRPDAWATLAELHTRAPERVAPACRAYGACGGCQLEHLAYPAQLAWKRGHLTAALATQPSLATVAVGACVASPRPLGYRNKSKLVYAAAASGPVLGAYAPRSHAVVDLDGCAVAEAPLDELGGELRALLAARAVVPYDEASGIGLLRYAILRVSHAGRVQVTLVTAAADFPGGAELAAALMAARPAVSGVVQNINRARGNVLYGAEERLLAGAAHLEERVGEVRLRLSPTAFFQVNRAIAARIYADLAQAAALDGSERVVDCYSGVGGIALTLAPRAREVVAIEEHGHAVADAEASASLNGVGNARFVSGDVAAHLDAVGRADVVVLNPPRRGCAPAVLAAAARLSPRLIAYVSCAPDTLARDLAWLVAHGYAVAGVTPYDMLPQTPHVEALALLTPTPGATG